MKQRNIVLYFVMMIFVFLMLSVVSAANQDITSADETLSADHNSDISISEEHTVGYDIINKNTRESVKEADDTEIEKKDLKITVDPTDETVYGTNRSITGTFTDSEGKARTNASLKIVVNGKNGNVKTDSNGVFNFTTSVGVVGLNNVTISHNGGNYFNPVSVNTTFSVVKQDLKITVEPINQTKFGENVSIVGTFTDINNVSRTGSKVNVQINGKSGSAIVDETGTFTFKSIIGKVGLNNVTISHSGGNNFNPVSIDTSYIVVKQDLNIDLDPIKTVGYGENVTISGIFTDGTGRARVNSNVKVAVNGKFGSAKTSDNGSFVFVTKIGVLGVNNVTISHPGGENYNPIIINTDYTVIKQDLKFNSVSLKQETNDSVTVSGQFTDGSGKVRGNTSIRVAVNGVSLGVKTDSDGTFVLNRAFSVYEFNNVTLSHAGGSNYNPVNVTYVFEDPDVRIGDSNISPGAETQFLVLLPYYANGNAVFKINHNTISDKIKLENGIVMYTYVVPSSFQSETYLLELTYSGDEKYMGKTVNSTLTLTPIDGKVNPNINIENFTLKYLTPSVISANIDSDAFGTIIFKANDTNITSLKFSNGSITYNYTTHLVPGVYRLFATYTGNYKYYPTTVNSTLIVEKLSSKTSIKDITSKAGNRTLFTGSVSDELNQPVKNMNITFRMDGAVIGSNLTDANGTVSYYYTLPSSLYNKTYNISATGEDTKTHIASSSSATLTLKQLSTKVSVPNISTKPSKTVVITATVVDEFNNYVSKGVVTFKKDNVTLGKVNVSSGFAKLTYTTNYETSNKTLVYASYVGDWKYASSNGNGTYEVTQLKTTISTESIDAKPNSVITLRAVMRDQNLNYVTDGSVIFKINGSVIGNSTVKNGIASLSYTLTSYASGDYRISAEYLGSKVYKASSNTNILTVTRYGTVIKGSELSAIVGSKSTLSVNVVDSEKYNVNYGQVKFYVNNEYIGTSSVNNGYSNLEYVVPSSYDGKTVKYYVTYEKNDLYESSSYIDNLVVTHQKTVYVSPNGSDSNLGDKTHPFKTITYAIDHISLFGTVKLEAGTYSISGIVLNASINIVGSGKDKTFIDGQKSGVPVFNITKRNAALTLSDLTIRNAKSNKDFSAGAIVTSGKLNIANARFVNNTGSGLYSGGAIYTNGILNVTNTEFINNTVTNVNSQGGAIRSYDNSTYITNCKFESNQVTGTNFTGGSAIYGDESEIIINQTTFTKNIAKGKYITGGVIRVIAGVMVISDSTFTSNQVTATDYAMGGVVGSLSCGISVINSTFNSNTIKATNSAGGSVIYVESAALDIDKSKLNSNTLTSNNSYGGAIYAYKAHLTLTDNEINANKIKDSDNGYGGAIYVYDGQLDIIRSKFVNNSVKVKSLSLAGAVYSSSVVTITNSEFNSNNVNGSNLGGGAIANMGNLTVTNTNFINNNAYGAGNALTATTTSKNTIENNYWGSASPNWDELLISISKPKAYSESKLSN